jgi:hypothetical protein
MRRLKIPFIIAPFLVSCAAHTHVPVAAPDLAVADVPIRVRP